MLSDYGGSFEDIARKNHSKYDNEIAERISITNYFLRNFLRSCWKSPKEIFKSIQYLSGRISKGFFQKNHQKNSKNEGLLKEFRKSA